MTAYIECVECGDGVPWYYAFLNGSEPMHPGCAERRSDSEGCGTVAAGIRFAGEMGFIKMRGYAICLREGHDPETRTGYILSFTHPDHDTFDVAIHEVSGGWMVDHPRTGLRIAVLDRVCDKGRGPSLSEFRAEVRQRLLGTELAKRVSAAAIHLKTLNPNFY